MSGVGRLGPWESAGPSDGEEQGAAFLVQQSPSRGQAGADIQFKEEELQ